MSLRRGLGAWIRPKRMFVLFSPGQGLAALGETDFNPHSVFTRTSLTQIAVSGNDGAHRQANTGATEPLFAFWASLAILRSSHQQSKGGDPVSHCHSLRSKDETAWMLASSEV